MSPLYPLTETFWGRCPRRPLGDSPECIWKTEKHRRAGLRHGFD